MICLCQTVKKVSYHKLEDINGCQFLIIHIGKVLHLHKNTTINQKNAQKVSFCYHRLLQTITSKSVPVAMPKYQTSEEHSTADTINPVLVLQTHTMPFLFQLSVLQCSLFTFSPIQKPHQKNPVISFNKVSLKICRTTQLKERLFIQLYVPV